MTDASCPGIGTEKAGTADGCANCPSKSFCQSNNQEAVAATRKEDLAQVKKRLSGVRHKLLILSGKGGVGKSTVATQLAHYLSQKDYQVGLLDIDICGPSVPRMTGCQGESIHQSSSGWSPVYVNDHLSIMSVGLLVEDEDTAIIWRGPKKNGLIKQFLSDVDWGDLDFLLVDTPPGTSDEHLSAVQFFQASDRDGAIVVTTPQEVSLLDVRKELDFCRKVKIPILGLIENMSGFVCPQCKCSSQLFPPTTGGAQTMASEMEIPLLGCLPIDTEIGKACDEGRAFVGRTEDSPGLQALHSIGTKIIELCDAMSQK
ncbi:cytosolic Fe-S cluster assembly factor NUBP1 homolog [Oscarella lobularis]|uniref:cytosolic Fe-S cluster assembly factor NUBP1 homolog n=1 Tax=Oscarella lobularis TaxID=121494 RepID=UPI0033135826